MIYLKKMSELSIMENNGKILSLVFSELKNFIKQGILTKDIDNLVEKIIYSHSGVPSFKNYKVGNLYFPCSCCVSVNAELIHGIPGERVLNTGDLVSVDIGVYKDGFHVDACRTYGVGAITTEAKDLLEKTRKSFFVGITKAKIGNRLSDISNAIGDSIMMSGYGIVKEYAGHGVGRMLHEEPSILNYGVPGKGPKIREGMTLAIEPMVTMGNGSIELMGDGWTVISSDRTLSAHYENTVGITSSGCVVLTADEDELSYCE